MSNCSTMILCTPYMHASFIIHTFPCTQELQHLRNSLPDTVAIQRIEERLSALGNVVACNDYVALVHPDIDRVCSCVLTCIKSVHFFHAHNRHRSLYFFFRRRKKSLQTCSRSKCFDRQLQSRYLSDPTVCSTTRVAWFIRGRVSRIRMS